MDFVTIANLRNYLAFNLKAGELLPAEYVKTVSVTARRGFVGETITTVLNDEFNETENVVQLDPKTGKAGWVVRGVSGEEYIVSDSAFCQKYSAVEGKQNTYIPKGAPIIAVQIHENISFVAPWGELMNIADGGYIVLSEGDDIYGIQEKEFLSSYSPTGRSVSEVIERWFNL